MFRKHIVFRSAAISVNFRDSVYERLYNQTCFVSTSLIFFLYVCVQLLLIRSVRQPGHIQSAYGRDAMFSHLLMA